jgi:hypothetical protein
MSRGVAQRRDWRRTDLSGGSRITTRPLISAYCLTAPVTALGVPVIRVNEYAPDPSPTTGSPSRKIRKWHVPASSTARLRPAGAGAPGRLSGALLVERTTTQVAGTRHGNGRGRRRAGSRTTEKCGRSKVIAVVTARRGAGDDAGVRATEGKVVVRLVR